MPIGLQIEPFNLGLRRARQAKGWSRRGLALACGVDPGDIGAYEALKKRPTLERAALIAERLDVGIDAIFPEHILALPTRTGAHARPLEIETDALSLEQANAQSRDEYDGIEMADAVTRALAGLEDPREARVLRLRFGIGGGRHTFEEIAGAFGVSRERIMQIESNALRNLRHPKTSRALRDALGED